MWVSGALRIKNIGFSIDRKTGEITAKPVTVEVRTDTWHHWLRACYEACDESAAAREETIGADDAQFQASVEREFRAGMQAIAASAFALDAFYAAVVEHAPAAKVVVARGRAKTIVATLRSAFVLTNAQGQVAARLLRDVFRFRDWAVHPPASFAEPLAHPAYGIGMDRRFSIFRVENARSARDGVHQLLWVLLQRPRERFAELSEWAEAGKSLIDDPEAVS